MRCRDIGQLDISVCRIENSDDVALLHGEPHPAVGSNHRRVRIMPARIVDLVLGDFAAVRLELANIAGVVCGEPDVAGGIRHQTVRPRVRSRQCVLLVLPCCRIEPADCVRLLRRVPQRAVRANRGIVRAGFRGGELPLTNRDVDLRSGERDRGIQRNEDKCSAHTNLLLEVDQCTVDTCGARRRPRLTRAAAIATASTAHFATGVQMEPMPRSASSEYAPGPINASAVAAVP